jgi:predicted small lipoprotein YifL
MTGTALLLFLTGCGPKGPMSLAPANPAPIAAGSLEYTPSAVLMVEPGRDIEFTVDLQVMNKGSGPIRVDLSRSQISVDDAVFQKCRHSPDSDPARIVTRLEPGTTGHVRLTCRDIRRPVSRVDFKFAASGTGIGGEVVVGFVGLGERP